MGPATTSRPPLRPAAIEPRNTAAGAEGRPRSDWVLRSALVREDRVVRQRVVVEVELGDAGRARLAAGVLHLELRLDRVAAPEVLAPPLLRPQVDRVVAAVLAQPLPALVRLRGAPRVDEPNDPCGAPAPPGGRDEGVVRGPPRGG